MNARLDDAYQAYGPQLALWSGGGSVLLFPRLLAAALARQRFFHPLFLAGLQIKGVTFHFFNGVLLLDFAFEAAKGVFQ